MGFKFASLKLGCKFVKIVLSKTIIQFKNAKEILSGFISAGNDSACYSPEISLWEVTQNTSGRSERRMSNSVEHVQRSFLRIFSQKSTIVNV